MFFYLAITVSIIGLLIATYTDLKERIVKNKLNFGMAFLGLIIFGAQSIFTNSIFPIFYSFIGLCFGFFFGWLLWKIGVFAGGDVKLFMALGALNPFTPALINTQLLTNISVPIFPITLFLYSLVAFLPYGIVVLIYKLKKNTTERTKIFSDLKTKSITGVRSALVIATIHLATLTLTGAANFVIETIVIIVLLILIERSKKLKNYLAGIIAIVGIIVNYELFIGFFIGSVIVIVLLYGLIRLFLSSRILLKHSIKVNDLEEGMIPDRTLVKNGNKYSWVDGLSLKKIINYTLKGKATQIISEKNEIFSANKARGFDDNELKKIKLLAKKGLIEKTIFVKDSMPFVPTMLLGYVISLLIGDFLIMLIVGI